GKARDHLGRQTTTEAPEAIPVRADRSGVGLNRAAGLTLPVQPVHHEARAVVEEAARLVPDLSRAGDHGDLDVHPCLVRYRSGMGTHGYTPGGGRVEEGHRIEIGEEARRPL